MKANCPGGGTTTTDTTGAYSFLLQRGPCEISVVPPPGDVSTPPSIQVDVTHDISNVNFQLSCASGGQGDSASAAAAGGSCELNVKIQVAEPIRSGLALHRQPYELYPADFITKKSSTGSFACESGCADVIITVTNKQTGKPVPNADVQVSIGSIANVVAAGEQYLCASGPCATVVNGQTSDGGPVPGCRSRGVAVMAGVPA
ncbi:MAG: hypothetical protein ACLP01_29370 [Solirubrobacteraceae bacterium]